MVLLDQVLVDLGFHQLRHRVPFGFVLRGEHVEHVGLNDVRRGFFSLIGNELHAGLRYSRRYGVDEHGTTPPYYAEKLSLPLRKTPSIVFTLSKQIGLTLEDVAGGTAGGLPRCTGKRWSETAMRKTTHKILALLDEEQRAALLELADFGTAAFSAGLAVALLKSTVDFVASFI